MRTSRTIPVSLLLLSAATLSLDYVSPQARLEDHLESFRRILHSMENSQSDEMVLRDPVEPLNSQQLNESAHSVFEDSTLQADSTLGSSWPMKTLKQTLASATNTRESTHNSGVSTEGNPEVWSSENIRETHTIASSFETLTSKYTTQAFSDTSPSPLSTSQNAASDITATEQTTIRDSTELSRANYILVPQDGDESEEDDILSQIMAQGLQQLLDNSSTIHSTFELPALSEPASTSQTLGIHNPLAKSSETPALIKTNADSKILSSRARPTSASHGDQKTNMKSVLQLGDSIRKPLSVSAQPHESTRAEPDDILKTLGYKGKMHFKDLVEKGTAAKPVFYEPDRESSTLPQQAPSSTLTNDPTLPGREESEEDIAYYSRVLHLLQELSKSSAQPGSKSSSHPETRILTDLLMSMLSENGPKSSQRLPSVVGILTTSGEPLEHQSIGPNSTQAAKFVQSSTTSTQADVEEVGTHKSKTIFQFFKDKIQGWNAKNFFGPPHNNDYTSDSATQAESKPSVVGAVILALVILFL